MLMLFVKIGITFASAVAIYGFSHRKRNKKHHRNAMRLAFGLVVFTLLLIILSLQFLQGYIAIPSWMGRLLGEETATLIQWAHGGLAVLTLSIVLGQVVTGALELPIHKKLAPFTLVFWWTTYSIMLIIYA